MAKENENTVEQQAPTENTVEQQAPMRVMSFDETMEMLAISDQVDAINETKICGTVTKINPLPTEEKKDKKGQIILGEDGQPTFYDPMYWVNIGITGSDDGAVISADMLNEIEEGKKYVFMGYRKDRKFRVTRIMSKSDYVASIAKKRFGL